MHDPRAVRLINLPEPFEEPATERVARETRDEMLLPRPVDGLLGKSHRPLDVMPAVLEHLRA
jgi:hypothetical protein